jgi:hypothetical protein
MVSQLDNPYIFVLVHSYSLFFEIIEEINDQVKQEKDFFIKLYTLLRNLIFIKKIIGMDSSSLPFLSSKRNEL